LNVITASAGIAVFPEHVLDADSLVRALDVALTRARNAGGNRVEIFSAPAAGTAPSNVTRKRDVRTPA
jgi:hypothetical protein